VTLSVTAPGDTNDDITAPLGETVFQTTILALVTEFLKTPLTGSKPARPPFHIEDIATTQVLLSVLQLHVLCCDVMSTKVAKAVT